MSKWRPITSPTKKDIIQLVINDVHNPLKQHVFRIYKDRHITYNQAINNLLFYPRFQRATKQSNGYMYLLQDITVKSYLNNLKTNR